MDSVTTGDILTFGWRAWSGLFGDPMIATVALAAVLLATGMLLRRIYED